MSIGTIILSHCVGPILLGGIGGIGGFAVLRHRPITAAAAWVS